MNKHAEMAMGVRVHRISQLIRLRRAVLRMLQWDGDLWDHKTTIGWIIRGVVDEPKDR